MIWTNETPVVLYGASHSGFLTYDNLENMCNINSFIDKRANELVSVKEKPVHTADSIYFTKELKSESVVIVCVTNIFDHENIAMNLLKNGFSYIIYCPVNKSAMKYRSDNDRLGMVELYSSVQSNSLVLPVKLMSAVGLFCIDIKDTAVISKAEGVVTVNVPSMFAFTRKHGNGVFENSPIITLFPHLEVFEWFSGESKSNPRYYIDLYCYGSAKETGVKTSAEWERNILSSRKMVYERMRVSEEQSPTYFSDIAVSATWNFEGHFNMISGKHRAAYLVHRRKIMIPLTISEADYTTFVDSPTAKKLEMYLIENSITELPYPVYSPMFYSVPYNPDSAYYCFLSKLCRLLAIMLYEDCRKYNFKGLTVRDESYRGFMPILLSLGVLGCQIEAAYHLSEFDSLVGRLYHLREPAICCERRDICYDVVFSDYREGCKLCKSKYHIMRVFDANELTCDVLKMLINPKILHVSNNQIYVVGRGLYI